MANIKVRSNATKWKTKTTAAATDYVEGAQNPRKSWKSATLEATQTYADGVQKAVENNSFGKGVEAAGDQSYRDGIVNKGATRYAQGVAVSGDKYADGVAPYTETLENINISERGPKGSDANYDRSRQVGQALHARKNALAAAGGTGTTAGGSSFGATFTDNGLVVVPIDFTGTITAAEAYTSDVPGTGDIEFKYLTAAQMAASGPAVATHMGTISLANARLNRDAVLAGWASKAMAAGDYLVVILANMAGAASITGFVEVKA